MKYICNHCGKAESKSLASSKRVDHIYRLLVCKICGWRFVVYTELDGTFKSYGSYRKHTVTRKAPRIDVSKVPPEKVRSLLRYPHPRQPGEDFYF